MEGVYPGPPPGTETCTVGAKLGGLFQGAIPGVNELIVRWPSLGDPTSGIDIDIGLGVCPGDARRPGVPPGCCMN
jgi:hypothetical protein